MAKRKADDVEATPTKKPTKTPTKLRISLCIPLTVISGKNAGNLQQQTAIINEIARAATLYQVGEIVVLDVPEVTETVVGGKKTFDDDLEPQPEAPTTMNDAVVVAGLLQYFVTPPYLLKSVFAHSAFPEVATKFKHAAKLPKLTLLPFMANNHVDRDFREGIAIAKHTPEVMKKGKKEKAKRKLNVTKYVNVGLDEPVELAESREIPVHSRVTVDMKNRQIVAPDVAYGVVGNKLSYGYYTRVCQRLSQVFTELLVPEGYLGSVFVNCDDYFQKSEGNADYSHLPQFLGATKGDVLVLLGNYRDYARAFAADAVNLAGIDSVAQMFDSRLEVPTGARIEDASLIALATLALLLLLLLRG